MFVLWEKVPKSKKTDKHSAVTAVESIFYLCWNSFLKCQLVTGQIYGYIEDHDTRLQDWLALQRSQTQEPPISMKEGGGVFLKWFQKLWVFLYAVGSSPRQELTDNYNVRVIHIWRRVLSIWRVNLGIKGLTEPTLRPLRAGWIFP